MITKVLKRFLLICISILAVGDLKNWKISATETDRVCRTPQCTATSKMYKENMNLQINPCDDFFGYVCGKWGDANLKPHYNAIWKVEELLKLEAISKLQKILEDRTPNPIQHYEQAKALYKACLNIPHMGQVVPTLIKAIIDQVGHWPMLFSKKEKLQNDVNWWDIDNKYIRRTGESALYDIGLRVSEANNNKIRIVLRHMTSPYGMLQRTELWASGNSERSHYKAFLTALIKTYGPQKFPLFGGTLTKDLSDVMRFRDELRKILKKLNRPRLRDTSIGNFQVMYNKRAIMHENTKINWLTVYRSIFEGAKDPYGAPIQETTSIQIEEAYIYDLTALLAKTAKHVIVNHIHLYFVERHATLNAGMLEELEKSFSIEEGLLNGFKRHVVPRPKWCITDHNMAEVIRLMYSQAALSDLEKSEIRNLISDAKGILADEIVKSPWINQKAKDVSLRKLKHLSVMIGHSKSYEVYPSNGKSDPFDMDPMEPDAYYVLDNNRLYFSSSFLQLPMYGYHMPFPVTYGSTVTVVGHELQHAFDPSALYFRINHTFAMWPENMYQEFRKRAKCFEEQYANFRYQHIKEYKLRVGSYHRDTLDEDIADVMGVKVSYIGFKNKLMTHNGTCTTLPGFEKVACDKLFFIAFGNTFCAASTAEGDKYALQMDTHSLPRIRLNGALGNMGEFSHAFGCKPNDRMNLKKRCDIWKN